MTDEPDDQDSASYDQLQAGACSFCGRPKEAVSLLFVSPLNPLARICTACVAELDDKAKRKPEGNHLTTYGLALV